MNNIVSTLEGWLDRYLDNLQTLTAIDSGTKDKVGVEQVNTWLEEKMTMLGFSVERDKQDDVGDNLIARLDGSGSAQILLMGHSDTVFPKGTSAERPMTIDGDRIKGPGVCDMKAGLLTGLYAVEALQQIGFDDFGRITFLCVSDEEVEDRRSHGLIHEMAREADVGLTLESARANGDIVVARKGVRVYVIEAFGRAAHAGVEPEKGRNAIVAMAQHVSALDALNGHVPDGTINPGVIEGGSKTNVVPDYARLEIDVRAFTLEGIEAMTDAVRAQIKQETVPDVDMKMTRVGHGHEPMPYTAQVAEIEALAKQSARELGFEVEGAQTGGASDASIIAAEGKPVLDGLGPVGGLDHSPDEYILLSSIVPRTALLAKLIMAIT